MRSNAPSLPSRIALGCALLLDVRLDVFGFASSKSVPKPLNSFRSVIYTDESKILSEEVTLSCGTETDRPALCPLALVDRLAMWPTLEATFGLQWPSDPTVYKTVSTE